MGRGSRITAKCMCVCAIKYHDMEWSTHMWLFGKRSAWYCVIDDVWCRTHDDYSLLSQPGIEFPMFVNSFHRFKADPMGFWHRSRPIVGLWMESNRMSSYRWQWMSCCESVGVLYNVYSSKVWWWEKGCCCMTTTSFGVATYSWTRQSSAV